MSGIFLDPVEDGKPSESWILWMGSVAMLVLAGVRVGSGDYLNAGRSVLIAVLLWELDKSKRTYWERGYLSAANSVKRQVEDHD